jgi:ribosome-binding protein aMBF1 (putative translation factor)
MWQRAVAIHSVGQSGPETDAPLPAAAPCGTVVERAAFSAIYSAMTELHRADLDLPAPPVMGRRPAKPADPVPADLRIVFGTNVKAARLAAGLSLRELSKLTGGSTSYLLQTERGTANVTLEMVMTLARALGQDPNEMLRPPPPKASRPPKK